MPRCDNLTTKPVKTAYSATAGTAFVIYDKVRVPVANTLGKEGEGMKVKWIPQGWILKILMAFPRLF